MARAEMGQPGNQLHATRRLGERPHHCAQLLGLPPLRQENAAEPQRLTRLGLLEPRCRMRGPARRSEEHTSELQSLMRISYAVFCLKKKTSKSPSDTHILSDVTFVPSNIIRMNAYAQFPTHLLNSTLANITD